MNRLKQANSLLHHFRAALLHRFRSSEYQNPPSDLLSVDVINADGFFFRNKV